LHVTQRYATADWRLDEISAGHRSLDLLNSGLAVRRVASTHREDSRGQLLDSASFTMIGVNRHDFIGSDKHPRLCKLFSGTTT